MEFRKSKTKKSRRPLAEVQGQKATKSAPEHSTPHQTNSSRASSLAAREKEKPQQQTQRVDLFGFDDISSPLVEPSVTPIYDGNPGTPTSVVSTSTLDTDSCVASPVQGEECADNPRSYLVKSAFKRQDFRLRKRSPQKRVKRRILEKDKNDENDVDEHLKKMRDHFAEVAKFSLYYEENT